MERIACSFTYAHEVEVEVELEELKVCHAPGRHSFNAGPIEELLLDEKDLQDEEEHLLSEATPMGMFEFFDRNQDGHTSTLARMGYGVGAWRNQHKSIKEIRLSIGGTGKEGKD